MRRSDPIVKKPLCQHGVYIFVEVPYYGFQLLCKCHSWCTSKTSIKHVANSADRLRLISVQFGVASKFPYQNCLKFQFCGVVTPSLLALPCLGTFQSSFPSFKTTLFGKRPMMYYPKCALLSILLNKSDLKWCIHTSQQKSLFYITPINFSILLQRLEKITFTQTHLYVFEADEQHRGVCGCNALSDSPPNEGWTHGIQSYLRTTLPDWILIGLNHLKVNMIRLRAT